MRLLPLVLALAACGNSAAGDDDDGPPGDGPGTPDGNGEVFEPAITKVVIEIDYETGSEPFTGATLGFGDTFDLSAANLERLFAGKKEITLPRVIGDMQDVGAIADEELTVSEILELAQLHRGQQDGRDTKTYYLLWVSGNFATAEGPQSGVLGVSIGTTGVIAMFKDVINSTNVIGVPSIVRFVEQATIIHELGHAFGLVDNGVPMVTPHRDEANGAHCNNQDCVMFYLNEGASDATEFVQRRVLTGDTILFDAACLADADAQTGGL
jgi:hypothetical protein